MAPISRLVAITALAVLAGAASLDTDLLVRREHHADLARRQSAAARGLTDTVVPAKLKKRCPNKAKSSSSSTSKSTSTAQSTSTKAAPKPTTQKATPTPTPKAKTPAPPAPQPVSGNKKVGLAWPGIDGFSSSVQRQWLTGNVGGVYNWGPDKPNGVDELGLTFWPSLWGDKNTGVWLDTVVGGYSNVAIGCNEVNQDTQARMSVQHGIDLWQQYMMPLIDRGYTLALHSVSNAPSGNTWLQQFKAECNCWDSITYLNMHFYGTTSADFINYVETLRDQLGGDKDVIVTEVACQDFGGGAQCSMEDTQTFMEEITAWMDKTPYVKIYFWFGMFFPMSGGVNPDNGIINSDGTPNPLGLNYIGKD